MAMKGAADTYGGRGLIAGEWRRRRLAGGVLRAALAGPGGRRHPARRPSQWRRARDLRALDRPQPFVPAPREVK